MVMQEHDKGLDDDYNIDGDCDDPLLFLDAVMKGFDPRKPSELMTMIVDAEEFSSEGIPSAEDWDNIVLFAKKHLKHSTVTIKESHKAARTIAEYKHAKRSQVEVVDNGPAAYLEPLDELDIELFREVFNAEF